MVTPRKPVDPAEQPPSAAQGRHSAAQQPPPGYPPQQFPPQQFPPGQFPPGQFPPGPNQQPQFPQAQFPPGPNQQHPNPQHPNPQHGQPRPAQPYPAQYASQPYPGQPYPPPFPGQPAPAQHQGQPAPPQNDPEPATGQATRRAVIAGVGVAVVAGAAGFGWYSLAGPKPRGPAPSEYTTPGGATAAPTSLATVAEIPEGGGVVLPDQEVVLTRESGDKVHCFTAVCTHQGCLVTQVTGGKITCPCHGSAFDATTGAVVQGPASSPLKAIPVTVVNGTIYTG